MNCLQNLSENRNKVLRLQHFCLEFLLQSILFQKELILQYHLPDNKWKRGSQGSTLHLFANRRMQQKYRKGNLCAASSWGLKCARILNRTAEIYDCFPHLFLWQDQVKVSYNKPWNDLLFDYRSTSYVQLTRKERACELKIQASNPMCKWNRFRMK